MIYYSFIYEIKFNFSFLICTAQLPDFSHNIFLCPKQKQIMVMHTQPSIHFFICFIITPLALFSALVSVDRFNLRRLLIDHHKNPAYIQLRESEYSSHCSKHLEYKIVTLTRGFTLTDLDPNRRNCLQQLNVMLEMRNGIWCSLRVASGWLVDVNFLD